MGRRGEQDWLGGGGRQGGAGQFRPHLVVVPFILYDFNLFLSLISVKFDQFLSKSIKLAGIGRILIFFLAEVEKISKFFFLEIPITFSMLCTYIIVTI